MAEPIILNAVGKSGSCYIAQVLSESLNRPIVYIQDGYLDLQAYIVPEKIEECIKLNGIARDHLTPDKQTIDLLKQYQLKVIFHVRDLRQRALSAAHHVWKWWRNDERAATIFFEKTGLDLNKVTFNDVLNHTINNIPNQVRLIEKWLEAAHDIPILITTYEEFLDDETLFFKKILDFYNIPVQEFNKKSVPESENYLFRKGLKDEWRDVFTLEQQVRATNMIPDEFFNLFDWRK